MIKSELVVRVGAGEIIDVTIRRMAASAHRVRHVGVAVVEDEAGRVVGVVTDGDIRRAYAGDVPFDAPVTRIMSPDPVSVPAGLPIDQVPAEVRRRIRQGGRLKADIVRHVLVTDAEGRLVEIYDSLALLAQDDQRKQSVAVYGQAGSGLALAVALAGCGHAVAAIDTDVPLLERARNGHLPRGHEQRVTALRAAMDAGALRLVTAGDAGNNDNVHIIAAAPTLGVDGKTDLAAIRNVAAGIGRRLRRSDIVILRCRAPVGTARGLIRATIEKVSGLRAGDEFALAVAPDYARARADRAGVDGAAQIVGGLTARCRTRAVAFWSSLTPIVVPVESLEAAELAALASGAFRELSAAFAADLARVAGRFNIDLHALTTAVQRGDPQLAPQFLRPSPSQAGNDLAMLGLAARDSGSTDLSCEPQEAVVRFARRRRVPPASLQVAVLGAEAAPSAPLEKADAIVVTGEAGAPVLPPLAKAARRLVFDEAGRFDRAAIESVPGQVYATYGYMTPPRFAVIACDNGFGHVRRCAALAAALRQRGAACDLFAPPDFASRLDAPPIAFRTHSTPEGWRTGAAETTRWPERLPDLDAYDVVVADSLPEILDRRPDAVLLGHFLWTHVLPDADPVHVRRVDGLIEQLRPPMLGTGLLAADRLKAATNYEDVGFFAAAELDFLPSRRNELLVSSGLGAEAEALAPIRQVVATLAAMSSAPPPFSLVHIEPGLLPPDAPSWMTAASYEPSMYRGLAAAILRPGAGTVTDCLSRGVWMVWPQAKDHREIAHNAQVLVANDLGTVAASPGEAIDHVCAFAADASAMSVMLARSRALRFDAAENAARWLMERSGAAARTECTGALA